MSVNDKHGPRWHTREHPKGSEHRDPISGEFFADGSLKDAAAGLVREALQNVLDAAETCGEVRVRFTLRDGHDALPAEAAWRWFDTLRPQLTAEGSGIRDVPAPDAPCPFLVVEDFGTTGLTGDLHSNGFDDDQNHFYDFLLSDARTREAQSRLGSWGVGKNVFHRVSGINGYLAHTVRCTDGRSLTIGKCVLKIRQVEEDGETRILAPSCFFADGWPADANPVPCEDEAVAAALRGDFGLARDGEPGLSLVMPWLDESVTFDALRSAVLAESFFPILAGRLTVVIDGGDGRSAELTAGTLLDEVRAHAPDVLPVAELAAWSMSVADDDESWAELPAPPPGKDQKWNAVDEAALNEAAAKLRQRIDAGERVPIRVPLQVRPSKGPAREAMFQVFLVRDSDAGSSGRGPAFFRERLAISGVKRAMAAPRVRALVVIDEGPLADLLRLAEPPNHTDWVATTDNLKGKYVGGNHVITFVKEAAGRIAAAMRAGDEKPDADVTRDFFAVAASKKPKPTKDGGKGDDDNGDDDPEPIDVDVEPKSKGWQLVQVEGGFKVLPEAGIEPPARLDVRVAYDVIAGSPWKQYDPIDFNFQAKKPAVQVVTDDGVDAEPQGPNRLRLTIKKASFEAYVTGFDPKRDLITSERVPRPTTDEAAQATEADDDAA